MAYAEHSPLKKLLNIIRTYSEKFIDDSTSIDTIDASGDKMTAIERANNSIVKMFEELHKIDPTIRYTEKDFKLNDDNNNIGDILTNITTLSNALKKKYGNKLPQSGGNDPYYAKYIKYKTKYTQLKMI